MKCPDCGSLDTEFIRDDSDYDGNDNIWTWDVYRCNNCKDSFNIDTNDPYEDEDIK